MSGTCQDWNESAPGGKAETRAAVAAGLAAAVSVTAVTQGQAGRFYSEFGADVTDGHAPVGSPGDIGSDRIRAVRMRRTLVADTGSRMERQAAFTPEPPRRILSDEAMEYVNSAAKLQRKALNDPYLNGSDSEARGQQGAGNELQRLDEAAP